MYLDSIPNFAFLLNKPVQDSPSPLTRAPSYEVRSHRQVIVQWQVIMSSKCSMFWGFSSISIILAGHGGYQLLWRRSKARSSWGCTPVTPSIVLQGMVASSSSGRWAARPGPGAAHQSSIVICKAWRLHAEVGEEQQGQVVVEDLQQGRGLNCHLSSFQLLGSSVVEGYFRLQC